jgi:hypothetical protein
MVPAAPEAPYRLSVSPMLWLLSTELLEICGCTRGRVTATPCRRDSGWVYQPGFALLLLEVSWTKWCEQFPMLTCS